MSKSNSIIFDYLKMKGKTFLIGSALAITGGVTIYGISGLEMGKDTRLTGKALVRFSRTAWTVIQICYDYKRTLWGFDKTSELFKRLQSQVHSRSAERLRNLCYKNAGLYIKIGQHLGSLDYLLPHEYTDVLKVFHHVAPRSSLDDIHHVLKQELGHSCRELFESFDIEPIGSASLAQVHKAVLKDGRVVAVKVQHKDIQDHSTSDVRTMEFLVNIVQKVFPEFQFSWLVDETKKNLPLELDFLHEGKNSERLQERFSKLAFLKIPEVFWKFSSKRILTMEYCDGGHVNDLDYMRSHDISSNEVSSKLGLIYSEMIFVQGYIHCDPHPGNILIRKNGRGGVEIVLLDHGLYQVLTDDFRVNYCKLWQAIMSANIEGIKEYSRRMDVEEYYGIFACMLAGRTWNTVISGVDKTSPSQDELEELRVSVGSYLSDISRVLNRMPRQLILILKTNDLLRCIDHSLQTSSASRSFVTMAKCCVEAVARDELKECRNWYERIVVYNRWTVDSLRISLYELSARDFSVSREIFASFVANCIGVFVVSMFFTAS